MFTISLSLSPISSLPYLGEVDHALNLSKPKIVFCSKQTIERITKVAKNNKFIKKIVVFSDTPTNQHVYSFNQLMEDQTIPSQAFLNCLKADKNEDVALIVCSSGTTGLPKGVQLSQSNVLSTLDSQL